ncbi:thiolase family protein [Trujillonella endophytica]|uniref:Acetyl-CoA acetyltransferase n=1 Tax=Trujillonella endophytica TaxID=673521 RepID=A0A1H8QU42_9ACTN|nr:thiolase family protein [Trujillella endophytica]SEO57384.1 Acetyl-CoA acetyltransferase [Trujillella endophytica]
MSAFGAIAGLGMTAMGKVYGRSAEDFADEAVTSACEDAGLALSDLDGLLVNAGAMKGVNLRLSKRLGLRDLRLAADVQSFGSSAGVMVQTACLAIAAGMATTVACVFADDPLSEGVATGARYAGKADQLSGLGALPVAVGLRGAVAGYAMAARRHMTVYGTTSLDFAEVAVSARSWAVMNPHAQMRKPLTVDDHQQARMIAEPFRLFDCCLVSNGAVAVIVTSADRARDLAQPLVTITGMGQSHPDYPMDGRSRFGLTTGAVESGRQAYEMAGVTAEDIAFAELYDCFTFTTLVSAEDYGFCAKGEGGEFFRSGAASPGGRLPINTGGGQLSGYYMWGMTSLSEAVMQVRGQAGERQVSRHDLALVSGNGGTFDDHSTLILANAE